jgi:hypothetical protein
MGSAVVATVVTATASDLNQRIADFAGLVGLVLVLITLFTSQRQQVLDRITATAQKTSQPFTRELLLDLLLGATTTLLFLSGLPLCVDAASPFHPLSHDGPLRVAFLIVWALLPFLVVWQVSLACTACGERSAWKKRHPKKSTLQQAP